MVTAYLKGEPISDIAKATYRSPAFVKTIIENVGVPQRVVGEEAGDLAYLPEHCVSEDFDKDEIAWSAKYHSAVIVLDEVSVDYQAERPGWNDTNYEKKYSSKCYSIYVLEEESEDNYGSNRKAGFYAFSLAYDLGKLEHLKKYGVDLSHI